MPRSGAALVALLCSCDPAPEPAPPPPPPKVVRWQLVGAISAEGNLPYPGFGGAEALLGQDCAVASADMKARPSPCIAERWRAVESPGTPEVTVLRVGRKLRLSRGGEVLDRSAEWSLLGPTLAACLGDPMDLPPAGDPAGVRSLIEDGGGLRWSLGLRGDNPCRLRGELSLPLSADRVDTSALQVEDRPWSDGGVERARELLNAWLRLELRERWPELGRAEKILGLERLSNDPHPEAGALLRSIAERDPASAADARQALERQNPSAEEEPP